MATILLCDVRNTSQYGIPPPQAYMALQKIKHPCCYDNQSK